MAANKIYATVDLSLARQSTLLSSLQQPHSFPAPRTTSPAHQQILFTPHFLSGLQMEFFRGQWISQRLAYLQIDFGRILMRISGKFGISLGRMRSVVSVVSTDNFVTAARQGRLSLLMLRMLCQSKVSSKFSEFLNLTLTYKIEFFSSKFFLKYLFLFLYFDEFFLALFVQN